MNPEILPYLMTAIMFSIAVWGTLLRKKLPLPLVFVLLQVYIGVLCEVAGQIMRYAGRHNSALFNGYILAEFLLLIVTVVLWTQNRIVKRLIAFLAIAYVGVWCFLLFTGAMQVFASKVFLLGCLILSGSYFYVILKVTSTTDNAMKQPIFWICLGITIYFCSVIPLFGMFQYFENNNKRNLGSHLYIINDIVGIVRYAMILYGLTLTKKETAYVEN